MLPETTQRKIQPHSGRHPKRRIPVETVRAELEPTSVPEWDAEDEVAGTFADDTPVTASDESARAILSEIAVSLPRMLEWTQLVDYIHKTKTVADFRIPADIDHYDYYATELPLTLIIPQGQQLVRLRLTLDLDAKNSKSDPVVAYDLFPSTHIDVDTLLKGEASLDVAEGLQFALVAAGVPQPIAGITKCLGLKFKLPFQWTSRSATVQSSGRMSNPVNWLITDDAIQGGFTASLIIRTPKRIPVDVSAALHGELRRKYLGVFAKTQFKTFKSQTYGVG